MRRSCRVPLARALQRALFQVKDRATILPPFPRVPIGAIKVQCWLRIERTCGSTHHERSSTQRSKLRHGVAQVYSHTLHLLLCKPLYSSTAPKQVRSLRFPRLLHCGILVCNSAQQFQIGHSTSVCGAHGVRLPGYSHTQQSPLTL